MIFIVLMMDLLQCFTNTSVVKESNKEFKTDKTAEKIKVMEAYKNGKQNNIVPISQLGEGEICIIRKWTYDVPIGHICQRVNNLLVTLGKNNNHHYNSGSCGRLFDGTYDESCIVEIVTEKVNELLKVIV